MNLNKYHETPLPLYLFFAANQHFVQDIKDVYPTVDIFVVSAPTYATRLGVGTARQWPTQISGSDMRKWNDDEYIGKQVLTLVGELISKYKPDTLYLYGLHVEAPRQFDKEVTLILRGSIEHNENHNTSED